MADKIHKAKVGYLLGKGEKDELLNDATAQLGRFLATEDMQIFISEDKLPPQYLEDSEKISADLIDILSLEKRSPNDTERELITAIQDIDTSDLSFIETTTMISLLQKKLLACDKERPTIPQVTGVVADYFTMPVQQLKSKTRKKEIARPRQIAMFLSAGMELGSLSRIGGEIGGKDHATVLHARKTISGLLDISEKATIEQVRDILNKLNELGYFDINFFKDDKYNTRTNIEKLME